MDHFLPSKEEIKVLEGVESTEETGEVSNRWRNILAITLLVLSALSTLLFLQTKRAPWSAFDFVSHIDWSGLVSERHPEVGGDITVPPPPPPPPIPKLVGVLPQSTDFSAEAMLAKDVETGVLLFQKNEYETRPIASLTKLLSALVLLEQPMDWTTTTMISSSTAVSDSHVFVSEIYTLADLWDAALVASSNRAILALVDKSGLSREQFVARMNAKAVELGMNDSSFVEPTGLDDENISTASDVAILLEEAIRNEKIQQTLLQDQISITPLPGKKHRAVWSTNWLLLGWIPHRISDFRGGKTGFINASGYNFAMQVSDSEGHFIDVVVLGADVHEHRFTEARDLSVSIFENYQWPDQVVSSSTELILEQEESGE